MSFSKCPTLPKTQKNQTTLGIKKLKMLLKRILFGNDSVHLKEHESSFNVKLKNLVT